MATRKSTSIRPSGRVARPAATAAELDAFLVHFDASPALWTSDDACAMADAWQRGGDGQCLRAGLAIGCMTGAELGRAAAGTREEAVALAAAVQITAHSGARLHAMAEMMKRVETRLRVALCARADMDEVLAEGAATCWDEVARARVA